MGRASRSLVHKLIRAADSGLFEVPKGWQVFSRYRTAELFLKHPAPAAVRTQDARAYKHLEQQLPQVKLQPMRINSTKPSLLKEVVSRHEAATKQLLQEYQQQAQKLQQQQQDGQQQQQQQQQQQLDLPQRPSTHEKRQQALQRVQESMGHTLQQAGQDSFRDGSAVWSAYIQEQEEAALQTALKKLQQQQQAAAAASAGSK
eukprot:GHUV01004809.1.p1 GENE.GHUV01004809.1~~GHUV01004809.1.p1  ORF type:complete len:202 (+),score=107.73 GHUV01004809.1:1160-1765(+)